MYLAQIQFLQEAVMVREQRRLLKSMDLALKCCKTYQILFRGNGSVVQIWLCSCKYKNSVYCLHRNITLADHKHLRSVQEDHRALFSELHIKESNHPICSMDGISPSSWLNWGPGRIYIINLERPSLPALQTCSTMLINLINTEWGKFLNIIPLSIVEAT